MYSKLAALIPALMIMGLVIPTVANAQSNIFSLFCSAVRANLAQGPQSGGCLLQGQAANNNLAQQNQQQSPLSQFNPNVASGVNQNPCGVNQVLQGLNCVPTSCPTGQQLSTTTPVTCIITPTIPTANAGPSQVVSRGSTVTLDGSASVATTSGATIVSYTCSNKWISGFINRCKHCKTDIYSTNSSDNIIICLDSYRFRWSD